MNKSNLKSYAPQARKDFITAVTARASLLGITAAHVSAASVSGGVAIIDGMEWPAKVAAQRQALLDRIARHGAATQAEAFAQTMEEVAYTWFNRLVALRYLEIHELLDHGHRVLSSRDGGHPELLRHAADVALPGLQVERVQALQLAGNQDNALYKLLLVAQCNELSRTMPFLFERIDDDTELLLPDNLLRTDSIIAKLVAGVPEEDWQDIEVIGWLYQFYISEKKDQVIGKVVKSEDIPAATQLFTPNWIVQYLVQNSVGRLWLMANPASTLASQWLYYIQPAEQTPEVQAQLDALIHTRVAEDGDTLNPESITVLDPACGSGHILVVAYDVLKAIYLERGYRLRDIPRLILEKNLYGLDIDDRAAQLAGFALLMKARADDRRLLADPANPPKLNVLSLQESKALNVDDAATHLAPFGVQRATVRALADAFEHAKTFGSLIQIPYTLKSHLNALAGVLELVQQGGDMYAKGAANDLAPLVLQAQVLAMQFDAVVANPPYMGGKGMNVLLKEFASDNYPDSKTDLYSIFIERCLRFALSSGYLGYVTPFTWMFISSYTKIRELLFESQSVETLVKPSYTAFFESAIVSLVAFTVRKSIVNLNGLYFDLGYLGSAESQSVKFLESIEDKNSSRRHLACKNDFVKIPTSPIAFWATDKFRSAFQSKLNIDLLSPPVIGMMTNDNNRFLRFWHEIDVSRIGFGVESAKDAMNSTYKWFPYNKGGGFKKWAGLQTSVVNWFNGGEEIAKSGMTSFRGKNYYFKAGLTWGAVSSGSFSCRFTPIGSIFDIGGASCFPKPDDVGLVASILNSKVGTYILNMLNPTVNFQSGDVRRVPIPESLMNIKEAFSGRHDRLVKLTSMDWDSFEESWGFKGLDLLSNSNFCKYLGESWAAADNASKQRVLEVKYLEELNNIELIDGYGLQNELTSEVPEDQITLARADREKDCQRLISYAIGCMMGRYSLDVSGLIYAHAGNVGFDANRYTTFPADADGILPVTDEHWFADDAPERIREFLLAVWGPDTLEENMAWLAESLGAKAAETPAETIRRYIATKFFKDHLQTYKKRPIYWLFSSGKQGAFQALVYLHRYNESTLARMRAEYVIPLTAKMANRLEMLEQDAAAATSTAARTKLRKQIETLRKQQAELLAYDEKLRHHADMRITLDLDDGVKVNYGKFGDLLEGVKLVTGGSGDE
jgi:hypothetical protein